MHDITGKNVPWKELNGTGRLVWVSKVMVVIGMK
jgi:hypothetical protein